MIQKIFISSTCTILFIALALFTRKSFAQLPQVDTWDHVIVKESAILKETDKRYDQVVHLEPFFYTLNNKNMKHSIEKYDADMNWVAEVSFKRSEFLLGADLKVLNGELYYVDSENDYKKKTSTISFLKINKETLLPEGEPLLLVDKKFDSKSHFRSSKYSVVYNDEKDLIGLMTFEKNAGSATEFKFSVYNHNFEVVNTLNAQIPNVDSQGQIHYLRLVDENKVVFGYHRYPFSSDKDKHAYGIGSVSQNGLDFLHDFTGKYSLIYPEHVQLSNEGDLIVIEHYWDDPQEQYSGIYFLKLDGVSGAVLHETVAPFSREFLKFAESESRKELVDERLDDGKYPGYFSESFIAKHQFDDNSTLVLLNHTARSESYVVGSRNQFGVQNTMSSSFEYNAHLWYFNDKGDLLWATKIPRFTEGGWYQNGLFSFVFNDDAYVIFMDAPENIRSFGDETPAFLDDIRNAKYISMVKVNKDGTLERKALYQPDEEDLSARITLANQFEENKIVLPMKTKNRRQLKLIEFDF